MGGCALILAARPISGTRAHREPWTHPPAVGSRFKIVNQARHSLVERPNPPLEGRYIKRCFTALSSGPRGAWFSQPSGEAFRKDDWNAIEIQTQGDPARIQVHLNGRLITDFQHTEATGKGVGRRGGIALQVHPDVSHLTLWRVGNRVRFRNIRIKELDR